MKGEGSHFYPAVPGAFFLLLHSLELVITFFNQVNNYSLVKMKSSHSRRLLLYGAVRRSEVEEDGKEGNEEKCENIAYGEDAVQLGGGGGGGEKKNGEWVEYGEVAVFRRGET